VPTTIASILAGRNAGRVDIPILGDSVTEGYGASAFTTRYVEQLNTLARQAYPTTAGGSSGGLGLIPLAPVISMLFTWPVAGDTAGGAIDVGPIRYSVWESASEGSAARTWTAPAGTTSVRLMYFDSAAAGTFSYQVGAGAATDVSNSGAGVDGALTAPIPIGGGEVLTIAWVSGNVFLHGIVHYAGDEGSGITFHACGHSGSTASTASSGWMQTGSGFDWRPAIASLIPAAGAFGVFLGLNDASASVGDETAAQFQADLENMYAYLRGNAALASLPLLAVVPYDAGITYADAGGYPAYVAAVEAAAAHDGNAQVVNLGATMPSYAADPAYYYNSVHPNDSGHLLVAQIIEGALAPPAPPSPGASAVPAFLTMST